MTSFKFSVFYMSFIICTGGREVHCLGAIRTISQRYHPPFSSRAQAYLYKIFLVLSSGGLASYSGSVGGVCIIFFFIFLFIFF